MKRVDGIKFWECTWGSVFRGFASACTRIGTGTLVLSLLVSACGRTSIESIDAEVPHAPSRASFERTAVSAISSPDGFTAQSWSAHALRSSDGRGTETIGIIRNI